MVFGALKKSKASKGGGEAEHAGELVSKPTSSNTSSKKKSGLISPANTEPVSPSPDKKKANKSSSKDKSSSADKDKSSTSKQSKSSSTMSDSRRRLVRDVRALSESDEELTVAILSRLVQATRSSSARTDFVEASGIQSLVAAMVRYKRCLKVVEGGCIILQNLAVDPTHRRLLVQNSAVKAIVGGMKDHPSDESIQELGCAALRNLGSGADAATSQARLHI